MRSDELYHYGTPRHSGRYPWGSGEDPYQSSVNFLSRYHERIKKGETQKDIAKSMNMSIKQLRAKVSVESQTKEAYERNEAKRLFDKGYSYTAIAKRMQKNESSVRSMLRTIDKVRANETQRNMDILREAVDKKKFIDVGKGVEQYMGISADRLDKAVNMLHAEGYSVHRVKFDQLGTGKETTVKVLCPPGTSYSEAHKNRANIRTVDGVYSEDGGYSMRKIEPPRSIDSKRVSIVYSEDGGTQKDGLIELRRGVDDISLGNAKYAQVRIAVDGTHYIKGMAVYADDLPDGVDIRFNTNKSKDTPMIGDGKKTVLKPMKEEDPSNPFGATIKTDPVLAQRHYIDKDGNEQLSCLNIVSEEGDWSKWHKSLASQFLSKQSPSLARQQLDISMKVAQSSFDDMMALTNPTVKRQLLEEFSRQCDADAANLKAAALPGQTTKVLIPFTDLKPNEIYAPNLHDGEHVCLVRYPHGGIFEIPTLVVNNRVKSCNDTIQNARDAVGINSAAAERLSGADFDGDTALVIPIDNVKIKTKEPLKGLVGFDPKEQYPYREGMKVMSKNRKGMEMGVITNLISDMTVQNASDDELARAVRHSMVIIDSEKHKLDYTRSYEENGISELVKRYQGGGTGWSRHALFANSSAPEYVPERKEKLLSTMTPDEKKRYYEGEMIYEDTKRTKSRLTQDKETGDMVWVPIGRTQQLNRMDVVDDAYDLVSTGKKESTTQIERVYADYANYMKALAKKARKEARALNDIQYDSKAKETYIDEYNQLKIALNEAKKNAPLERRAQLLATERCREIFKANPDIDEEHRKRTKGQQLDIARKEIGASKKSVVFTDRQWEAINAGAISPTFLKDLLINADSKRVKALATPKTHISMPTAKKSRAKSMLRQGYSQAEVADMLGVSVSTLMRAIDEQ